MKNIKRLLPVLLVFVLFSVFIFSGNIKRKSAVKSVLKTELNLLRNLDSETVEKYISYNDLFPDAARDTALSGDIQNVFSLFFRNFDYRILGISLNSKDNTAELQVRLETLDAAALAKDYAQSLLKHEIFSAAELGSTDTTDVPSVETRYLLLNELLKEQTYKTVLTECSILLERRDKNSEWEIKRTSSLENDLTGGLITHLADPDILSPAETLSIYLDALTNMDAEQLYRYLQLENVPDPNDPNQTKIAKALVAQITDHFSYEIRDTQTPTPVTADVRVVITTFDSDSILEHYQERLDLYLESSASVIDGASGRTENSYKFLLNAIEENEEVTTAEVDFHLENDGISWKLKNSSEALGNAIFGTLSTSPVESESE